MAAPSTIESSIQRWAHPRVLVLASGEVERMLAKNHLTFAELLKPLGAQLENVPAVYFRSVTKNYTLKHFGVKFVAPLELEAAAALALPFEGAAGNSPVATSNIASTEQYLDSVLRSNEPPRDRYTDGIQEQADVSGFLRTTPDPTGWFSKYRSEFHEVLRYHESELIDQPLALLVAVSTTDANPLNLIEQLRGLRNLPAVFQKGVYDSASNLLRSIVVLHDKHAELSDPDAKERGANTFRLIKKQYGNEVLRMLELNSLPLDQPNLKQKDVWKTDCERTKWQLQQVRRRANENSSISPSSAATTSSPSPFPYPLIQPIPSPMPTHAPILTPSASSTSVQANLPHPPSILTSSSATDVPHSEGTPEPSTPSSQSIASLSAATSALTTNALEEMGADEAATVEEEQAQLKLKQQEEALRAQVIQQQNQAQAQQLAQSSITISSPPSLASGDASSSSVLSNSATSPTSASLLDRSVPAGQARGQYLSPQDLVQTSAFIGDFLLKSLLPHLERKMSVLGEKVAAVRKGFKNSLKAFFGKQRDTSKNASFNMRLGTYDWNTIESQARQLADLAFVVQDYELAASTYRVCAGDYKQDKIPRHFAGSQEMLGLAIALGDNSGVINSGTIRDLTQAFEGAVSSFLSVGDVRRATRSSWFFSDCLRWIGGQTKVNECSAILLRASEKEQSVRAALCMEQAAYLFLYHIPTPLVRKYSFHLVMAGHIYHKYLQKIFGVRAYNAATILYEHRAWFSVNDHLNYNLAKEYFHLNRYEESVKHFIELIGKSQSVAGIKPKQTQEKQTVFLKEFVFVIKKWQELEQAKQAQLLASGGPPGGPSKSQQVPGLKLPTVLDDSISVRTNDRDTVPAAYTIQGWNLALRVNPLMTLEKEQCNKPLFTPGWNSYREADRGAVVNETITLQFQISNPLLIELPCSNLRLKCKWKKKPVDGQPDEDVESREGVAEGQPVHDQAVFVYSALSITLQPLQTASVSLTVRPLKQGTLYIEGMNWEVMEVLKGFHPFALPLRQVTFPVVGGRRRKPELQQDPSLVVPITPPAPLLSIQLSSIPSHLHHSEVIRVSMQLTNHGSVGLHAMCLRFSHPGFMVLTNHSAGGKEAPFHHTWNEGYIQLPFTLAPQQSLELPLYIRGTLEGKHQLSMLMKYEPVQSPVQAAGTLKHRLCHLTFPLLVTPLLNVSVFTRPSFQWLHDSLLGVEIADAQQSIPSLASTMEYRSLQSMDVHTLEVRVNRLSCLSKMWSIAPLTAREGAAHNGDSHHNHHDGLVPPRALHESVSTPVALKRAALDDAATVLEDTSAAGAGQAHLLRPYESLLHFFRVSNMEGTFGLSHSTHVHGEKPVHTSASANNLTATRDESAANPTSKSPQPMTHAQGLAARKPAHSSVSLSPAAAGETNPQSLDLDPSHPAIAHLLHMEKALMVEAEKQTLIVNPAAVLADVGAPNRLDVALCWRSVDGIRGGIHHTPGLACMKARPSACSLKVLLHFPREISHDFLGEGSLDVPVHVAIRNTLEDAAVTFSFETLPPEEEFDANKRAFKLQSSPCLRGRYTWSGSTKCRVTALSPGEEVSVNLFAFFQAPGVYNLNRFRFTVEVVGKKPRVFFFPLQHLIHITQAATSFQVGHNIGVNGANGNAVAVSAEGAEGAQRAEGGASEDLLSLGQPEEVLSETHHSHSVSASASDPSAAFSFNPPSGEGGIASASTDDMQVSELGTSVEQEEDQSSNAAEGVTQAASEIQDESEQ